MLFFWKKVFGNRELHSIFAVRKGGAIAQLVEQWTENPCVLGSIPSGTTTFKRKSRKINDLRDFLFKRLTELMTDLVQCIKSYNSIVRNSILYYLNKYSN